MGKRITHVAVYAMDLETSKEYYVRYFDGECGELYQNQQGFSSYFISFGNDVRLEVMHSDRLRQREAAEYERGWSHVAFSVGGREAVLATTRRIVDAGYALYSAPGQTGDGYFESCVADPDGNRVEITI
jgi:lactoylglutathione lyase